jgi:hypothetical protein
VTYRRWLTTIFLLLLASAGVLTTIFGVVFYVIRQPDFPRQIQDPALVAQDAIFSMHNRDCQVLIYGDSTAWNGVDPHTITEQTGLSACNIAVSRPIVDALGTAPLDTFLANNPRPRFLILQYGPEVFYRSTSWEHIAAYFPLVMLIRDFPVGTALRRIAQHPAQDVQLISFLIVLKLHNHAQDYQRRMEEFDRTVRESAASGGRLFRYDPHLTTCVGHPVDLLGPLDAQWVHDLRAKYQTGGTTVLIVASPLTECDPQADKFRKDLSPLVDDNVEIRPSNLFVDQRHPSPEGAPTVTLHLIPYLECHLKNTPCPAH